MVSASTACPCQRTDVHTEGPERVEPSRRPLRSAVMAFHDITMTSITGDQVDFSDYEGNMALVVNVASA